MPTLSSPWQLNREEYDAVCDYLDLSPNPRLYDKLSGYLASAPSRFEPPDGFARFLAGLPLTRFRITCLDPVTKHLFPGHRLRHVINGALALHECDPEGYRQMAVAPRGIAIIPKALTWGLEFLLRLPLSVTWLGWQAARYALAGGSGAVETIKGQNIIVTGVNRGLGLDIMLHCLERGARVIGIVRDSQTADQLRAKLPADAPVTLLTADLATPGALVGKLTEARIRPETVSLAVMCAGVKHDGESVLSLSALRDTFQINYFSIVEFAAWYCDAASPKGLSGGAEEASSTNPRPAGNSQAMLSAEVARGGRARLAIVSSIGRWHGMHATGGYNASKAALSIWGESLEMELRKSSARRYSVTIVEPGMFQSGMSATAGLARLLSYPRLKLAEQIVSGALAGKKAIRKPTWFTVVTWVVCVLGREFRYRLFSRVKPAAKG